MKQRLLYAFLMLFAVLGMARAADVNIKVTSTGGMPVTVTLDQAATVTDLTTTHSGKVTLSTDGKKVTLAQGYTAEVEIISTSATTATVTGRMDKLEIAGDSKLKTLNLSKDNYVKELIVSGSALESLTCSGLGMETLTLTGASALKTLDASDNKLVFSEVSLPSVTTKLISLNLSGNALNAALDVSSYNALTELNVSKNKLTGLTSLNALTSLAKLDISDNNILNLSANPGNPACVITWGVQTLSVSSISDCKAHSGVRISNLITEANIPVGGKPEYSNVTWQVKKNNVYEEDNSKTVHQPDAWDGEYRFYDATTKEFVQGTYQCSLTTGGRQYKLTDLTVNPAEFSLQGVLPVNAKPNSFKVSINGGTAADFVTTPQTVKQGEKLLFTLEPNDGYETAVYTVKGMVPAISGQQEPYKGKSIEFIVKGLYDAKTITVAPQITAVVLGKEHPVSYENKTQEGGSFTVQKVSGTTTSDLASGKTIATGEKLLVKIKPNTGYDFKLTVNGADKTSEVKVDPDDVVNYTYSEDIANANYADNTSITVSVTFINPSIDAFVKVNGAALASSIDYIADQKVTIQKPDGTTTDVQDATAVELQPNTTYQAIFTTKKLSGGTAPDGVYRLKDITINGGELKTVEKDKSGQDMKYTVAFTVKTSDVTISITTKTMQEVDIKPVINDGVSGQLQTYDGKVKPVLFSTVPANLNEHVKITYKTNDANSTPVDTPINAGKYKATLVFEENDSYIPKVVAGVEDFELEITKASLTIETLPIVTVEKDKTYKITGGKVIFNNAEIKGTFETSSPSASTPGKSHPVKVTFAPTLPADAANFEDAEANVNVMVPGSALDLYKITMNELPTSYSIQWLNGNKPVDISTDTFAGDTELTAIVTYPKGTKGVELKKTSDISPTLVTPTTTEDGMLVYTVTIKENTNFSVVKGSGDTYNIEIGSQKTDFTGEPLAYNPETGLTISDKNDQPVSWATISSSVSVTYKDASGKVVALPVDAGTYTVCVSIAADKATGYVETTAESAAFIVNKIKPVIYTMPKASVIAKGQTLSLSDLTGGAVNIPGKFTWKDGTKSFSVAGSYKQPVVFTPEAGYDKNYLSVETGGEGTTAQVDYVSVSVSDLQIVTFVQTEGTITVTNQLGQTLPTGSAVTKGDVLTIKVEPREGLELKSLTVNGSNNTGVYTVGTSSVAIEATFQPKVVDPEPSDPVIDPNSQYAVTLPKAGEVRGVVISKPGVNAVLKDKSFSFTLGALAADLGNIVVKVNGTELKSTDGTYTIAKVSENTTVQISLANPTPLKVSVETVTKNDNGYVMGKVQVDGPADGVCYYNDVITLVAYPESGVMFNGWSDDKEVKSQLRTLTLTQDVTIKPLFSGIPTGIESVVTARIYGTQGNLVIEGVTQGKVTIVSMDGRMQRQQVSGDGRIQLAGGVYGVILEDGSNVIRTKVIVK